jgi:hypothetical protein
VSGSAARHVEPRQGSEPGGLDAHDACPDAEESRRLEPEIAIEPSVEMRLVHESGLP